MSKNRADSFSLTERTDKVLGVPKSWILVCFAAFLVGNFLISVSKITDYSLLFAALIGGVFWLIGLVLVRRDPDFMDQFNRYHREFKNPDGSKDQTRL